LTPNAADSAPHFFFLIRPIDPNPEDATDYGEKITVLGRQRSRFKSQFNSQKSGPAHFPGLAEGAFASMPPAGHLLCNQSRPRLGGMAKQERTYFGKKY
jgi:hypothetical protein